MSCGCGCQGLGETPIPNIQFPLPPGNVLPTDKVVCENGACCAKQSVWEDELSDKRVGGYVVGGVLGFVLGGVLVRFLSNRGL